MCYYWCSNLDGFSLPDLENVPKFHAFTHVRAMPRLQVTANIQGWNVILCVPFAATHKRGNPMGLKKNVGVVSALCMTVFLMALCGCRGLVADSNGDGSVQSVNHVIFMLQENRSFDTYFGMLNPYRQTNKWNVGDD